MTLYLLYIAVILLFGWYVYGDNATDKQKKNWMLGISLFLVLFMSLRYYIGYDYVSYLDIFEEMKTLTFSKIIRQNSVESSFFLLAKVVGAVGLGYHQFLFICNIIMVGCVMWTIYDHSSSWWLSSVLYMTLQIVPYSMNLLRQAMAASFIFAAWGLLKKGKMWQYCLVVLLASTFHISAIIMLPLGFLMRLPFNLPMLAGFCGLTALAYLFFDPIVRLATMVIPRYSQYLDHPIYSHQNGFSAAIVPFIYCILTVGLSKPLLKRDKTNAILIYTSLLSFAFSLMITRMYIIERFAIYFFIYSLVLLPEIVAACKDSDLAREATVKATKKGKKPRLARDSTFVLAFILVVSLLYMYWNVLGGSHKAYPYVGIWEPQKAVSNNDYYSQHT